MPDVNWKKVSYVVIAVWIVGILGYDLIPALTSEDGDTISEVARDLAWGWQTLPAFVMFMMAHLFWHRKGGRYFQWSWVFIPVVLAGTVLADIFLVGDLNPLWVCLVYFPLGHLVWPQDSEERLHPGAGNES